MKFIFLHQPIFVEVQFRSPSFVLNDSTLVLNMLMLLVLASSPSFLYSWSGT